MLQFIPIPDSNILAIRASGKLTHEDYQAFLPHVLDHACCEFLVVPLYNDARFKD